jgi:hypothetical protein
MKMKFLLINKQNGFESITTKSWDTMIEKSLCWSLNRYWSNIFVRNWIWSASWSGNMFWTRYNDSI